jgi:hypothetical protein
MRKTGMVIMAIMFFVAFYGCNKPQPEEPSIITLVSTTEVENEHGSIVEALYSDGTRMYFRLLSDTTAEVVSYHDFYDCEHESEGWIYRGKVTVPEVLSHAGKDVSVVGVGSQAFGMYSDGHGYEYPSWVTEVVLPKSIISIGDMAFFDCSDLTSVNIPSAVTYIGYSAFAGTGLTSIEIPNSLTVITMGCFADCEHLNSVKLPNTLVRIDHYAFSGRTPLVEFEIPESVAFLGDYVFSNNLKTLICRPTTPPANLYNIPDEGPIYLSDSNQIETIYVPMESVEAYKGYYAWQLYRDIITGF